MSDVTIRVTVKPTMEELKAKFGSFKAENFLRDEIRKIAFSVERFSKQLTPVDTGRLRSSITVDMMQVPEIGATIAPHTDYAIFVHEGTRYMRARPFMQKGAEYAGQFIEGQIKGRLDEELARHFKTL